MIDQASKEKHHKLIIKALKSPKTALDISTDTGLTQHQVSRRMSELINLNKVFISGAKIVNRKGIDRKFNVYSKQ